MAKTHPQPRKSPPPESKLIDPAIDALLEYLAERAVLRDSMENPNPKRNDP